MKVEFEGLIAGKPAPTGFMSFIGFVNGIAPCGSWLASDSVIPGTLNPAETATHSESPRSPRHTAANARSTR
ncbi:hypothetical protein EJA70_07650 [Pseudomonas sp. PB103]|nr:hypothetical protein EJA70_07650 [Pseudomonas sp. PB103]